MAATNVQSGDVSPTTSVTSPWSQVVSPVTVTLTEEVGNGESVDEWSSEGLVDVNVSKKPVWNNRFSNGVVDAVSQSVMGTAWPTLGESTKPTLKSSSLDALSDASLTPALQVTGSSSPSHKQAAANNLSSTPASNHVAPSRQRSMKRGGGNSSAKVSDNGVVDQTTPPANMDSVVETAYNAAGKPGNGGEQASPRDHAHKELQKGRVGSESHGGNDQRHQKGSYRRGNGGSFHHNYGGKRDHDRGNTEWNQPSRSFNNRDAHSQPQRGFSRGYIRPAVHTSAPFIPPPMHVPVPPFGNNMMYPDVASSLMYYTGPPPPAMPFGAPIQPQVYFTSPDPLLYANIVNQIDYYFSNENLVKDTYLRRNMDEQGWVSVSLIAGFKKVSYLTDNVQLILDAMRASTLVEVQGDKLRRRNDWMKWIMPAAGQFSNPSSPHTNPEPLVSQVQSLSLHGPTSANQVHSVETYFSRSSSGEFTGGEEKASQQARFDHATAA